MNKRAFSLIELVMVIMFLGILVTVAAIAVESIFKKGTNEVSSSTQRVVTEVINDFLIEYDNGELASTMVNLEALRAEGYLKAELCDKVKNELIDLTATEFTVSYDNVNEKYKCVECEAGTLNIVTDNSTSC